MDLNDQIARARQTALKVDYAYPISIGPVDSFDPEALLHINAKVMVREHTIYLIECNTYIHDDCAVKLTNSVSENLNEALKGSWAEMGSTGQGTFPGYVNSVKCGTCGVGKLPDGAVRVDNILRPTGRVSFPFVVEIGYRNENLKELLIEGANWTNSFTDTDISIMLSVNEDSSKSDVISFDFVIFKRKRPLFSDCVKKPKIECLGWSAEDSIQARSQLENKEIEKNLRVQLIAHINITRSFLRSGNRVSFLLPTSGLNAYYNPDKPFKRRFVPIDLTDIFFRIFAHIDISVKAGTYPNPA